MATKCQKSHEIKRYPQQNPSVPESGHRGVYWETKAGCWKASVWFLGVKIHLGYYVEKTHAIVARQAAERVVPNLRTLVGRRIAAKLIKRMRRTHVTVSKKAAKKPATKQAASQNPDLFGN